MYDKKPYSKVVYYYEPFEKKEEKEIKLEKPSTFERSLTAAFVILGIFAIGFVILAIARFIEVTTSSSVQSSFIPIL